MTSDRKIRLVYNAEKRRWGQEARFGYKFFSNVRNQARLTTAALLRIPVGEVKAAIKRTGGPQTTPPNPVRGTTAE